ncbi:hypothetical protein AAY24_05550 [Sedimenticola thiotaurini]|uniref:Uncharacterized protein n=1 Tax=Sedimenticola thiotaurini TaxID=1543721 RepID=A0A0F7JWZ5_9GAMM|nr:hypothetical protein AAY24_05550 [Sedimenticola thiotaurini]
MEAASQGGEHENGQAPPRHGSTRNCVSCTISCCTHFLTSLGVMPADPASPVFALYPPEVGL